MATVATLQTDLILNSAAFRSGMLQAAQTAQASLGKIQAEASKTAVAIDKLSVAAEAFVGFEAVKEGIGALVEAQVQLQQIHYTLLSATGSAVLADDAFGYLQTTAQKLGLNLQPAAQAFGQLSAAANASGISLTQTKQLFEAFGQASTVLHLSSEQSQHALLALTEMMSRGTIQSRQLNQQLGFAIPGSAARFKNAVMEAVKGTDLAGKSFEQLEKAGDLVTSRFMPQLIQALRESGRGWEEAATGLNAQINRLKTAWFDLKTSVSGGLFNDAATASIGFVAQNLDHIASTLTVIGGLGIARLLAGPLSGGAAAVSGFVQQRQALIAQTAANVDLTNAQVAETAASVRQGEAALAGVTMARQQALAARQQAEAAYQQAIAENEAAQATLRHQATAATLSANLRAQATAAAEAEAAQAALNRAQAQYDASIAATNTLKEQQITLDARLLELRAANTAAIEAQSAAQAAQAATGVGASIGSALGAAGRGAMALLGGPWGVALAGIGALGYVFLSMAEDAKRADEQFRQQLKDLSELPSHVQDVTEAYKALGSTMSTTDFLQQWKSANDEVSAAQTKIAALKGEIAGLTSVRASLAGDPQAGPGAFDFYTQQIKEAQTQLAALETKIQPTRAAFLSMSDALRDELGPSFDKMRQEAAKLNEQDFSKWIAQLEAADPALRALINDLDQLRSAGASALGQLTSEGDALQRQVEDFHKGHAEQAANHYRDALLAYVKSATAAGLANTKEFSATVQALNEEGQRNIALGAEADAQEKSRRSTVDKLGNAYANLKKQLDEKIAAEHEELSGNNKLTDADKFLLKVKQDILTNLKNLSPERKRALLDEAQELVNLTNENVQRTQQNDALAKEAVLRREIQDTLARQQQSNSRALEGIGHGTQWNQEQQAIERIVDEYDRMKRAADDAYEADIRQHGQSAIYDQEHADALKQISQAEQEAIAGQQQFYADQQAAQGNWHNGMQAAFEDLITQGRDVASQTRDLFTNAFGQMNDALANFVTTGKLNFGSLVKSILADLAKMELRIIESKILQSLLGYFTGAYGQAGTVATNYSSIAGGGAAYANGGLFDQSGATHFANGGAFTNSIVTQPTLFAFANGTGLMGEAGPEAIMPLERDPSGKLGVRATGASSGGDNITVNIVTQIDNGGNARTQTSGDQQKQWVKQFGDRMRAVAQEEITRARLPGGQLWRDRVGQTA